MGTVRATLRSAAAAVFISTTVGVSRLPEAILVTLFDLTPAEGRVLAQLGPPVTGLVANGPTLLP